MRKGSKIYVAGHTGLVGSALLRKLKSRGYDNLLLKDLDELDLRDQRRTRDFFLSERPDYVFLAAAKVGGILANSTYKADFIYDNMMIAANVISAACESKVKKLLNLGSSCIYPKNAPQPLKEEYLLTSPLEPTNEPYAIAKIAAIKMCRYYNEQYGTDFISVMPTNLYGPGDNFDLDASHVLPALLRKFRLAKLLSEGKREEILEDLKVFGNGPSEVSPKEIDEHLAGFGVYPGRIVLWGTGEPYREFLYVDDLAEACFFLMENSSSENKSIGEFINVGTGEDIKIRDLAVMIKDVTGFKGKVEWDTSRPDGTPKKLLDVSGIKALGWEASTGLREGIERTFRWYEGRVQLSS